MLHMSKCFQAIEKLKLDKEDASGDRPKGLGMISCVGTEYMPWSSPLALENKVEMYMNAIVKKMREELQRILKESIHAYPSKPRDEWLFDWPSQIILVVNQIFWVSEVEKAFQDIRNGKKDAMKAYNAFQIQQLTRLIQVTRTELSKSDRQKVLRNTTQDESLILGDEYDHDRRSFQRYRSRRRRGWSRFQRMLSMGVSNANLLGQLHRRLQNSNL